MNIYRQTITQLERHNERYHIDLKTRTLRVGRKVIIADGKPVDKKDQWGIEDPIASPTNVEDETATVSSSSPAGASTADILAEVERRYAEYKHSVPGYNEQAHYFKALKYEELDTCDLLRQRRITAQFQLEYFLLFVLSTHRLRWWMGDKYFWRSDNDRDLVILRDWIEPSDQQQ